MLIRCRGASAPSRPPPLRGRGTPSLFLQTDSPANHNHGSAALHLASRKLEIFSCLLSPPQRRGTRGRINKYFKVGGLRLLQALTPRERCSRFIVTNPSGPLSRHRERGWGERADAPAATLGAILCAVRIDFGLPSKINPYPAQPATGVLGRSPKRVLVPFTRVKGTPRRRAVLIKFFIKLAPPIGDNSLCHVHPPLGDYKLCHVHPRRRRNVIFGNSYRKEVTCICLNR